MLDRVSKRFGRVQALSEISLSIVSGAVHCLLGENGAGKSTLCNLVFGVYQPDAGTMLFDGKPHAPQGPADALRAGIAMVHQHFSLVPDMTVTENVLLGRTRGGQARFSARRSAAPLRTRNVRGTSTGRGAPKIGKSGRDCAW